MSQLEVWDSRGGKSLRKGAHWPPWRGPPSNTQKKLKNDNEFGCAGPALDGSESNARPRHEALLSSGFIASTSRVNRATTFFWWRCFSKMAYMVIKNRGKILEFICI